MEREDGDFGKTGTVLEEMKVQKWEIGGLEW